jgi:hypothetical protein
VLNSPSPRCACTLRRTSLPHSSSDISAGDCPRAVHPAASKRLRAPPDRARPRGLLPCGRPDSGPALPRAPQSPFLPWASDSPPRLVTPAESEDSGGSGVASRLSWHARDPRRGNEPHSPRTEGPDDVGSALDPAPRWAVLGSKLPRGLEVRLSDRCRCDGPAEAGGPPRGLHGVFDVKEQV